LLFGFSTGFDSGFSFLPEEQFVIFLKSCSHCSHWHIVYSKNPANNRGVLGKNLLHQQHLPGALDGFIEPALIMRGKAGVFAREDAALIGDELAEQVRVLEIEGINGEIDLRLWPGRSVLVAGAALAALVLLVGSGFARHKNCYLISLWSVCLRSAGLYFLISSFSVLSFLLRVVV
jgi:hypothetical protein